jgi:hypothetical protein
MVVNRIGENRGFGEPFGAVSSIFPIAYTIFDVDFQPRL